MLPHPLPGEVGANTRRISVKTKEKVMPCGAVRTLVRGKTPPRRTTTGQLGRQMCAGCGTSDGTDAGPPVWGPRDQIETVSPASSELLEQTGWTDHAKHWHCPRSAGGVPWDAPSGDRHTPAGPWLLHRPSANPSARDPRLLCAESGPDAQACALARAHGLPAAPARGNGHCAGAQRTPRPRRGARRREPAT